MWLQDDCAYWSELAPRKLQGVAEYQRSDYLSSTTPRPATCRYAIDASKIARELGWTPRRETL